MIKIDAMGKACPLPVIETKKALRLDEGKNGVTVLVDNFIATQNLEKMATQMKLASSVKKINDSSYEVIITALKENKSSNQIENKSEDEAVNQNNNQNNNQNINVASNDVVGFKDDQYVVAIASKQMGIGEAELGEKLLNGFIYSLTEQDVLPKIVVFYNSGVFLTTENSNSIEDLKALKAKGVEILSCGLCLNYYNLTQKLQVGEVTNMYRITEILRSYNCIRP